MPVLKKLFPFALAVCLVLFILGSKWDFVGRYGTDMPDLDQWDAEAIHLLAPWFSNDPHFLHELFLPHNEHRIVPSKLQNLALTLLGGNWDARVETVANAVVHTLLALILFLVGRRWLLAADRGENPRTQQVLRGLWFLLVAACFAVPLAWENVLGGFHSQQYWLLLCSLMAMLILPFAHPRERLWWLGAFSGALALVSMGSGFLAAAASLAVIVYRLLRRAASWREVLPSLVLCVVLTAIGWLTRTEVPYHAELKATSVSEFLLYARQSLQWPVKTSPLAALLFWAPWLAMVYRAWREPAARVPATLAMLGGWTLLQVLATAYARGKGADWPAPRYQDTLLLGFACNGLALLWWFTQIRFASQRIALAIFGVIWLSSLAAGMRAQARWDAQYSYPAIVTRYRHAEENMRGYLATNDMTFLDRPDIPYPGGEGVRYRLDLADLRQLMPASMRPALPLHTAENAGFIAADSRTKPYTLPPAPRSGLSPATASLPVYQVFGSYTDLGAAAIGTWRSAPLTATPGSWLKFETAGALGEDDDGKISLTLNDAATGRVLATVLPPHPPGDGWRAAYVRTPAVPFTINATDASPDRWLAFTAPAEMTWLSHLAWALARHGRLLLLAAGIGSALLGLAALACSRPHRV